MRFGEKVKLVRQKLMLSQEDFAKELNISFATVNRWENGKAEPNYIKQRLFNEFCKSHGIDEDKL
jgi:DNA-binding transcriptional regulator YiaG